jgi:hypothetical protein
MTDLTHFNVVDVRGVLERADAGDESARTAVARHAREWLWQLLGTVATDRAQLRRLERAVPIPITREQVSQANALIEQLAPAAESTTNVQVALGSLALWLQTDGEYPRILPALSAPAAQPEPSNDLAQAMRDDADMKTSGIQRQR